MTITDIERTTTGNDTRTRIQTALDSIASDWPELQYVPLSGGAVTGAGSTETRLPGGTQRLNLIADAQRTLMFWALVVLEGRDLPGASVDAYDVPKTAQWLALHADWLADELPASDVDELRDLAGSIRSHVAPAGVRRFPIGACPATDCPGVVMAVMTGDPETDANQALTCDVDAAHHWTRSHYGLLARALGMKHDDRMTPPDLAGFLSAQYGKTVTVRHLARWARDNPMTFTADQAGKYDRVTVTDWYLEYRSARAQHAA